MRWITIFVFQIVMLGSCAKLAEYTFPFQEYLDHELIPVDVKLFQPVRVIFLEDIVLVLDEKTEYFIHAFCKTGFVWYGSFLRRGHGPGEETSVWEIRALEKNKFLYNTDSKVRIMEFDIETKSVMLIESFEVGKLNETFLLNRDLLGFPKYISEENDKEFLRFCINQLTYTPFGTEFLSQLNGFSQMEKNYLSYKWISVHPDHQLFAMVYQLFPVLRICNSADGSLRKEIRLKSRQPFPHALLDERLSLEQIKELTWGSYLNIQSTTNYIYALYVGRPVAELYPSGLKGRCDYPAEIHVWDWNGNPVKRIQLDRQIHAFTVSPDDRYMIATSMELEDYLLKFGLWKDEASAVDLENS